LADARNETHWNAQVSKSELMSAEPVGSGSAFRTVNRGKEYTAAIIAFDRPNLLTFDVKGSPMDITASFRIEPDDARSVLRGEFDMRPKGLMKVMFPLLKPMIRRDLARQSQSLKAFCESSSGPP